VQSLDFNFHKNIQLHTRRILVSDRLIVGNAFRTIYLLNEEYSRT